MWVKHSYVKDSQRTHSSMRAHLLQGWSLLQKKYSLKNVNPTDFITTSYIGYAPKTVPANSAILKEGGIGNLDIKIDQTGVALPQIDIVAEKPKTKVKTNGAVIVEKKPEEKAKEPIKLWVKIALGVGAVTVFGIIIFLATKDNKGK